MKYWAGKSLPVSVAVWFEQQLEGRGIDSAPVYSHYIISLLQDDTIELNDIPLNNKSTKKGRKNKYFSSEIPNKSAIIECLTAACDETFGLDELVDELYKKLKAAISEENENHCLIEKTSAGVLTLKQSSPISASKYHSAFPPLGPKNSTCENNFKTCVWPKNLLVRNKELEVIPKESRISKKRDFNKENLVIRGRMRSRSMVKQQGGVSHRSRNTAKSLDRKDERSTPKFSKGKQHLDIKNRKCVTLHSFEEPDLKKVSRTPCTQENFGDISEFLPMDFQQLLQSPEDGFPKPCHNRQASDFTNFIQCGTNIISSIWSEKSEKMEEEAFPEEVASQWEVKRNEMRKNIPWSTGDENNATTSWKVPLVFGTLLNNNNNTNINNNNYKKGNYWSDVENTSLALKDDVCYFSCLGNEGSESTTSQPNLTGCFSEVGHKPIIKSPKKKPAVYTYKQTISDQEDDLLTSTKTHFKPIKHEAPEPVDQTSGTKYEDGTCFSVSSSLEKVNFQRSESGSLYLGPDQKYMEFKPDRETPESTFVPKFKVNLNEKFCQTDDTSRDMLSDKGEEFYFPEDEQLAEDMVNSLIEDDEEEARPTITLQGFLTTWPVGTSDIWSNNAPSYDKKSWMFGNTWNGDLSLDTGDGREHYMRLRNELSEDGEELLSDLSSIHLFIDSEHIPDSKVHYPKRMRFRPCSFHNRNMANESLA